VPRRDPEAHGSGGETVPSRGERRGEEAGRVTGDKQHTAPKGGPPSADSGDPAAEWDQQNPSRLRRPGPVPGGVPRHGRHPPRPRPGPSPGPGPHRPHPRGRTRARSGPVSAPSGWPPPGAARPGPSARLRPTVRDQNHAP
jgi:hypothetical protein